MENGISSRFAIGDKPNVYRDTTFPYEEAINSLRNLHNEKCLRFRPDEITQNNLTYMQQKCKKSEYGKIRSYKKDGLINVWLVKN